MKSTSVLSAAVLLVAAKAGACEKKEPPKPSEAKTTSAPIDRDRPVEITGGTMTTSGPTGLEGTRDAGGSIEPTESTTSPGTIRGGRDAGLTNDWPAVPLDRDRPLRAPSQEVPATSTPKSGSKVEPSSSTPLGGGGGEGIDGGEATHGAGPKETDKSER